jgi:hypothetical protein
MSEANSVERTVRPRFWQTYCSQCGQEFGPGDCGFSHCSDHKGEDPADKYGNPLSGDRIINCCFPDCGCDGARLCQAENGASGCARSLNIERGTKF